MNPAAIEIGILPLTLNLVILLGGICATVYMLSRQLYLLASNLTGIQLLKRAEAERLRRGEPSLRADADLLIPKSSRFEAIRRAAELKQAGADTAQNGSLAQSLDAAVDRDLEAAASEQNPWNTGHWLTNCEFMLRYAEFLRDRAASHGAREPADVALLSTLKAQAVQIAQLSFLQQTIAALRFAAWFVTPRLSWFASLFAGSQHLAEPSIDDERTSLLV